MSGVVPDGARPVPKKPCITPTAPPRAATTAGRLIARLTLGAALTSPARADEPPTPPLFSVGAIGGDANGRVDCVQSYPCDHHAGFGKVTASASIASTVEVQASYFRVGNLQGGDTTPLGTRFGGTFKLSGVGFTAGYRWDFTPGWDLTARVASRASAHALPTQRRSPASPRRPRCSRSAASTSTTPSRRRRISASTIRRRA